jgi:hypothetical protein
LDGIEVEGTMILILQIGRVSERTRLISNPEVEVPLDIKREGFFCVVYTASKSKSVVEDVNSISRDDLSRAQESQSRKRACVTAR